VTFRGSNRIIGIITFRKYDMDLTEQISESGLVPEYDWEKYEEMDEDDPDYIEEGDFYESEEYQEAFSEAVSKLLHLPPSQKFDPYDYDWQSNPEPVFMSVRLNRGMDQGTIDNVAEAYANWFEEEPIEVESW
jgi:hypothetical protein